MRTTKISIVFYCLFIFFGSLFSQDVVNDNIPIPDSTLANNLFKKAGVLAGAGNLDSAELILYKVKEIYKNEYGPESQKMSDVLFFLGSIHYNRNQYEQALEYFFQTLGIAQKNLGENHPRLSGIYLRIAYSYQQIWQPEKAQEAYDNGISLLVEGPEEFKLQLASLYNNYGSLMVDLADYKKATELFQKALDIRLARLGEDHVETAKVIHNLGVSNKGLGNLDKAFEYYKKNNEIVVRTLPEDHPEVIRSWRGLGTINAYLGNYMLSISYDERAKNLLLRKFPEYHSQMAGMYQSLGEMYRLTGAYDKAIEYGRKAEKIYIRDKGQNHPDVAQVYDNLANAYQAQGDLDYAINLSRKALLIRLNIMPTGHPSIGESYSSLGMTLYLSGNHKEALDFMEKAIEIKEQALGTDHPDLANYYQNIAAIYTMLDDTAKANAYCEKSLVSAKSLGVKHPEYGHYLYNYGCHLLEQNKYEKAMPLLRQSQEIFEASHGNIHPFLSGVYTQLGRIYLESNEIDQAVSNFDRAIKASGFGENSYGTMHMTLPLHYIMDLKGQTLLKDYKMNNRAQSIYKADSTLNIAEKALDHQRNQYNYDFAKRSVTKLGLKTIQTHVTLKNILFKNTAKPVYFDQCFQLSEKGKSLLLLESWLASKALDIKEIPDSLLEYEHQLRFSMGEKEENLYKMESSGFTSSDSSMLSLLRGLLMDRQQHDSVISYIENHYPRYYSLKYGRDIINTRALQGNLLNNDISLLEFFTGDSSIFLFLINQNDYQIIEIKKDFPLEDWVAQLQSGLSAYHALPPNDPRRTNTFRDSCEQQYIAAARNLYDKLVKPVAPLLKEEVIVVPDGVLGYVPFEVLLTDAVKNAKRYHEYPYLLREHRIRYTYSATLLQEMMDKKHRREPEKRFGAFAPYYDGDTTVLAGLDDLFVSKTIAPGDLQPLKYSGAEVAAAQKLMGGDVFTDTSATEDRFNAVAGNYRILHLSTHGKADDRVGDYSYLVFSPSKDSVENELLYCRDIYNLSLNADLVVLSACETGLGKLSRGEGIISLARAFAYAGAKSIVNSLWSVNDASTEQLMVGFYKGLKAGQRKSTALAQAKRRFLAEPAGAEKKRYEKLGLRWEDFRHPYYWGGFILIGDDAEVK